MMERKEAQKQLEGYLRAFGACVQDCLGLAGFK
jgi:hypothetical protein